MNSRVLSRKILNKVYFMLLSTLLLQNLLTDVTGQMVSAYILAIVAHQIYRMTATQSITVHLLQTSVAAVKNLAKNQCIW